VNEPDWKGALGEAFEEAVAYLQGLSTRPIPSYVELSTLRAALGGAVPERPVDPREVVADLVAAADAGVQAPRDLTRVTTLFRELFFEVIDLLEHVDRNDHIVLVEVEHCARIVEKDVGVEDGSLPHLSAFTGTTHGAVVAA